MTREEAIVLLECSATEAVGVLAATTEPSAAKQLQRYIDAYDMAIAALREQPQWISVEDRLPEKYNIVLCYKDKQWRLGYYIGASYSKGVAAFRHPKDQFAFGVTHWMPLPEPPEVEV